MPKARRRVPPLLDEWTQAEMFDLDIGMAPRRARAEGHERYSDEARAYIVETYGPEKLVVVDASQKCETWDDLPPVKRLREKWHRVGDRLPRPPSEYAYAYRAWGPPQATEQED